MKDFLIRAWSFYTKHTLIRHAITGAVALAVWNYADPITDLLMSLLPQSVAVLLTGGGSASLARWAQMTLESLVRHYVTPTSDVPEEPAA